MTTLTIEVSEDLGEPRHLERRAGYLLNLRCRKLRTRLNAHATAHRRAFHWEERMDKRTLSTVELAVGIALLAGGLVIAGLVAAILLVVLIL